MIKSLDLDKVYQFSLITIAFFMPLTVFGANFFIVLVSILWLCSGNYGAKLALIRDSKLMLASILFFLLHLAGLVWTDDMEWGFHILHKMWYFLLLFPIFYTIVRQDYIKFYVGAFLIAITISEIVSYLIWFGLIPPFKYATISNPTAFMSHVSYNPILAFSIYLLCYEVFLNGILSKLKNLLYLFFAITMSINMFITGGRAGQVMFFLMVAILSFQIFSKKKFDFIGKRSLYRSDTIREDRKQLVGLITDNPEEILEEGAQIVADMNKTPIEMLGHVTSSYFSPNLKKSIALGVVKGGKNMMGQKLIIPMLDPLLYPLCLELISNF